MKKLLPILLAPLFFLVMLFSPSSAFATGNGGAAAGTAQGGQWVIDPEVTFIGKNAARSGLLLDWTLRNYNWVCVRRVTDAKGVEAFQCDDSNNPIQKYWSQIMVYIVVPLLFVVLLGSAAVIIITRGRGLSIMRFIPRFIAVIVLIVFSYSLVQFFFQFTDLIQGFFLRAQDNPCPPACISQKDLLYVGWQYQTFVGIRLIGDYFAESAFVSLLLTKLTALTYYVMVLILIIRKIILWFFIIVSPVFPLLLMYSPTRNTGKIWIGEFFRWLLYAPLFAIFLKGLVELWRSQIPLIFTNPDIGKADKILFPTAVNILLGGPKQFVTTTNSVNLTETFALYVVALIMLWTVILLPWILLQIFLEYAANFTADNSAVMKTMVNMLSKQAPTAPQTPVAPIGSGSALSLPFAKKFSIPKSLQPPSIPGGAAKELPAGLKKEALSGKEKEQTLARLAAISNAATSSTVTSASRAASNQVLSMANLAVPSMRDIAKLETKLISRDSGQKQEVASMVNTLAKIANPASATNIAERERFEKIHDKLVEQKDQGNVLAAAVLNASSKAATSITRTKGQATAFSKMSSEKVKTALSELANPASASVVNRQKMSHLNEILTKESQNSKLASAILDINKTTAASDVERVRDQILQASQKADPIASIVLSAISNSSQSKNPDIKTVLQQIANPLTVSNATDREAFSKAHDALTTESKENNNQLATSILSVNGNTSTMEIDGIKEALSQGKESQIASAVITAVNSTVVVPDGQIVIGIKNVLEGVTNPSAATDSAKFTELHKSLESARRGGNSLAEDLLSVNDKTSVNEIAALEKKLSDAKAQGVPFAAEIFDLAKAQESPVPAVNRIQTVTHEHLNEVRDLWKQNYSTLDVPETIAGTRTEWIKDDMAKIEETINLLSSHDQEKINQGMGNIADLLPFLLAGGFSQSEIVQYLQAKKDAATDVLQEIVKEEEQKVSVGTKRTQAAHTMAATMEEPAQQKGVGTQAPSTDAKEASPVDEPKGEPKDILAEQEAAEEKLKQTAPSTQEENKVKESQ